VAAVAEDARVEVGDLVWHPPESSIRPAREAALWIDEPYTPELLQQFFCWGFLGVAMQRSETGEAAPIRVATTGVFVFDAPEGRYRLGTLMGPAVSNDGSVLRDQCVAVVSATSRAIGRVEKCEPTAQASVLVRIYSQVMAPIVA